MSRYFDNAATTKVRKEVIEYMLTFYKEDYGNPSSIYSLGKGAKVAIDAARETVAAALGAKATEVFFTGSGTESNNWAIKGVAKALESKGKHIITTKVEHHAVLHTCEYLEKKEGYRVTYLDVNEKGQISLEALEKAICPDTILISIMFANNETGTISPVAEIGAIAKKHQVYFHTDAVQVFGHMPIDVDKMHIDLLSFSAHKLYAPKGVGGLYIRQGIEIETFIHGGAQERNKRAGTENVAGIAALGLATELAMEEMAGEITRQKNMRDRLEKTLLNDIPFSFLNGDPVHRLPSHLNIGFEFIEGEGILLGLNRKDIATSSGSACTSASLDASHVLLAMGVPHERAHGTLRLTLGRYNTEEDIDALLKELPPIIDRLRQMSPLYDKAMNTEISI